VIATDGVDPPEFVFVEFDPDEADDDANATERPLPDFERCADAEPEKVGKNVARSARASWRASS
jgi:hypothetical protein